MGKVFGNTRLWKKGDLVGGGGLREGKDNVGSSGHLGKLVDPPGDHEGDEEGH